MRVHFPRSLSDRYRFPFKQDRSLTSARLTSATALVPPTMIDTHVVNRSGLAVRRPTNLLSRVS
jgi:hypothetical protein